MTKRYYLVRQEMPPGERAVSEFHGLAFIVVSEGTIELAAGDMEIPKSTEFARGDLKVKQCARQKYEIITLDPVDFDLRKDAYLIQIGRNESARGVHGQR